MGKIKDKMMADFESHLKIGEKVLVPETLFYPDFNFRSHNIWASVSAINGDIVTVKNRDGVHEINRANIVRYTDKIGVNPLPSKTWHDGMTKLGYNIGYVKHMMDGTWKMEDGSMSKGFNFDPYIIDKNGVKQYYQRPLCWTLEEKQNFIESIYNDMNCGVVIIKLNDDKKFEETHCEFDVIDGKQRLHTLIEFFKDEFPDKNGYYYSDFSDVARRGFDMKSSLDFFQFGEKTPDKDIKEAFLNVNFKGVPVCEEHIDFVNSIEM